MRNDQKRKLLASTNGTVFTATFRKANGEMRTMNCRLGVKKHLKGGDSTTAHKDNLITVFDMQKGAYRCINLDTVVSAKINGAEINFNKGVTV